MKKPLTILLLLIFSTCFSQNNDKNEVKAAIKKNEILVDKVIPNKELAIKYAELILFNIYGKEKIKMRNPIK